MTGITDVSERYYGNHLQRTIRRTSRKRSQQSSACPKTLRTCTSSEGMVNIIDPQQLDKELSHTTATAPSTSKPPVRMIERADATNPSENCKNTVNIGQKSFRLVYDLFTRSNTLKKLGIDILDKSIQPSVQSSYPRQNPCEFMLYRTAPTQEDKKLGTQERIRC